MKSFRVGQCVMDKTLVKIYGEHARKVLGDRLEWQGGSTLRYKIVKRLPSVKTFSRILNERFTQSFSEWLEIALNNVSELEDTAGYYSCWSYPDAAMMPDDLLARRVAVFDYFGSDDFADMAQDARDILNALAECVTGHVRMMDDGDPKQALVTLADEFETEGLELDAWEYEEQEEEDEIAA